MFAFGLVWLLLAICLVTVADADRRWTGKTARRAAFAKGFLDVPIKQPQREGVMPSKQRQQLPPRRRPSTTTPTPTHRKPRQQPRQTHQERLMRTFSPSGHLEAFAAAPPGLEELARREISGIVAEEGAVGGVEALAGGVAFNTDLQGLLRCNLWSRIATRLLVRVGSFRCNGFRDLVEAVDAVDWAPFVPVGARVRVRATLSGSALYHQRAAEQRVGQRVAEKTGAVFVEGASEDVEGEEREEQHILLRVENNWATLSIDSSGPSLSKRGYRLYSGKAPIRENLAAAFLTLSGWTYEWDGEGSEASSTSGQCERVLYDPMMGSGTIPIEAAMIAINKAPGLDRSFAMDRWPCVEPTGLPASQRDEAMGRMRPVDDIPPIFGFDRDMGAVDNAQANARRAGVYGDGGSMCLEHAALKTSAYRMAADERVMAAAGDRLMVCNPPYGTRFGAADERKAELQFRDLYDSIGNLLQPNKPLHRWSVGLVCNSNRLANRLRVPLRTATPPVDSGGAKVQLFVSDKTASAKAAAAAGRKPRRRRLTVKREGATEGGREGSSSG
ncbi:unnamed protein product [Vitrella brassicaformis CCMP3155]|uniref:Uncharacterized protein n=1 Tax=Vitrella brassicaformis (strain CCMP3155) TaxID=1169540 RepID=A0A0G4EPH3_VITBC|nr:unnamed protein product [Vitrella brassicaformis CCMP3155]|eukprot:CEL99727.1 unnamed protein product [Vitrella brassicaformis CCMP3155]